MKRRMAGIKEALMVAAVACLMVGLAPGAAHAQASCNVALSRNFGPYVEVWNTTASDANVPGGCDAARLESRAWLDGWTQFVTCVSGSYVGSGRCEAIATGQGSALAHLRTSFCGVWGGIAENRVRNTVTNALVIDERIGAPLDGGTCRRADEECEDWEIWDEQTQQCIPYNSPILVPLTMSQAYDLTSVEDGVSFDMDGNGVPERTAWTAPNSRLALLAIDMNGDGRITSGLELVGDRLVAGKTNGWDALISLAPPNTTKLTEEHELFRRLLLWEDRNHDGVSQESELQPAGNVVAEIGLGYVPHNRRDRHGNKFVFQGWASVRTAPGKNPTTSHGDMVERNIKLYDVFFKAQQ